MDKRKRPPFSVHLQPLSALPKFEMSGLQVRYLPQHFLVLLSLVGLLVLIVGAVNFGIVTIGRLMTRGTEVGIRKNPRCHTPPYYWADHPRIVNSLFSRNGTGTKRKRTIASPFCVPLSLLSSL